MNRYKVLCSNVDLSEFFLMTRARSEDAAISKTLKISGVEHAEIVSDDIVSPDVYRSQLCPYSIMNKRGGVKSYVV